MFAIDCLYDLKLLRVNQNNRVKWLYYIFSKITYCKVTINKTIYLASIFFHLGYIERIRTYIIKCSTIKCSVSFGNTGGSHDQTLINVRFYRVWSDWNDDVQDNEWKRCFLSIFSLHNYICFWAFSNFSTSRNCEL